MAAHDDKISNNRRRLFKALSAAPVVVTLRPGEALASTSNVFQCAAKDMGTPKDFYYLETETTLARCNQKDPGCYVYEERDYWGPFAGLDGDCADANRWIVVDVGGTTLYAVVTPGNDFNPRQFPFDGWTASVTGQVLRVSRTTGSTTVQCIQDNKPKTGLFLVVGKPQFDNNDLPNDWVPLGVYPQFIPQTGNENLAGTCLDSFGDTTGFILAKG